MPASLGTQQAALWSVPAHDCTWLPLPLRRPGNRHYSLATYILLRGITLLIRVGNKDRNKRRHPALHALLAPTRIHHGDTMLMCAACECPTSYAVHHTAPVQSSDRVQRLTESFNTHAV